MTQPYSDTGGIRNSPIEILRNLIRFDTTNPPGNERDCILYIRDLLESAGVPTTIVAKDPNRPNLVARLKGQGVAPPLLMYGHVDVVTTEGRQWTHPPFEGKLIDNWVWGRGAPDMKSGVAMMLCAFLRARAEARTPAGSVNWAYSPTAFFPCGFRMTSISLGTCKEQTNGFPRTRCSSGLTPFTISSPGTIGAGRWPRMRHRIHEKQFQAPQRHCP